MLASSNYCNLRSVSVGIFQGLPSLKENVFASRPQLLQEPDLDVTFVLSFVNVILDLDVTLGFAACLHDLQRLKLEFSFISQNSNGCKLPDS